MFVQTHELKFGQVVPLEREGPAVRLLEQTGEHRAIFVGEDGKTHDVPAFEFFSTHREATRAEIEAWTDDDDDDESEVASRLAIDAAKQASAAADKAGKSAGDAATSAGSAATAAGNAAKSAAAAEEAAKKASAPTSSNKT